MTIPIIITGDDASIPVRLYADATTFSIDGTVKARLVSINCEKTYTEEVSQSAGAAGADWANALVVVQFTPAHTASIVYQGKAWLEIQVDDGTKRTWFVRVEIRRGNIA